MYKHPLKRVFVVLFGLLLSIALLSGCDLFNQKPITITKVNNVILQVDGTKNITVTTTPSDVTIKAVSGKASIATVSVNKNVLTIMGKAEGEAEITITATKSGYETASLKFTVIVSSHSSMLDIESVSSLADIEVAYGTLFEDIDLPETVEVTLDDQTKQFLGIEWLKGDYDCNTTGTYSLEGNINLVEGITNNESLKANVNVIVPVAAKGDIKSVEILEAKKVAYETEFVDIGLPDRVKVTLDDDSEVFLKVDWASGDYDGYSKGKMFIIEGSIVLYEGVTNKSNLGVTIQITVNNPPIITSLTPEDATFRIWENVVLQVSAEDPDGDTLFYEWKDDEGMFIGDNDSHTYEFYDKIGTHKIFVEISDGLDAAVSETRTFIVNAYPEITSLTSSENIIKIGEEITIEANVIDHENDVLTYSWFLDDAKMEGKTDSSITWSPTELGSYYFDLYVSDDGGEHVTHAQINIKVVENYIPEIKTLTGPENTVVDQMNVKFTAEYDHRGLPKEDLTVRWEVTGGTIVKGQGTGEIEWNAPSEEDNCLITFFVDDGVHEEIEETICVNVQKPYISIYCDYETVAAKQEYKLGISVDAYFSSDIQISATATGGELIVDDDANGTWVNVTYSWTAPEMPGIVTITFEVTINGVKFYETKEFNVIENQAPIIKNVLVNESVIDPDKFLVLNVNELYNFEIEVIDEDLLDIEWYFMPFYSDEYYNTGSNVEYTADETGPLVCYITVNDGISSDVEMQIFMFFEDDSLSEITDQIKIETIEMISDDMALTFEEKNLDRILNHLHPDNEEILRTQFEEVILNSNINSIYRIDRYLITFDPYSSIYTTYVLYKCEIDTVIENMIFPLFFKEDSNGDIKLYGVWEMNY